MKPVRQSSSLDSQGAAGTQDLIPRKNLLNLGRMKYPACFNELTETNVGGVVVDVCEGGCGGIGFDAFELKQVDEAHEAAGEHLLHIEREPKLHVDFSRKHACPRCDGSKLKRHLFGPKSTVEVDHCPNCAGYWLDAGELEKIRQEKKPGAPPGSGQRGLVTSEVIRYVYRMQIEMQSSQRAPG